MPAILQVISQRGMLAALGFNFGQIILEDSNAHVFLFKGVGMELISGLIRCGRISATEADALKASLVSAEPYFAKDIAEVLSTVSKDIGESPEMRPDSDWEFQICPQCITPIPHGYIQRRGNPVHDEPINSLESGFYMLQMATMTADEPTARQAVKVLREMKDSGLLLTMTEAAAEVANVFVPQFDDIVEVLASGGLEQMLRRISLEEQKQEMKN